MDCLSSIHYVRPDRQLFPSKAYMSSKCLVRRHLSIIGTNECDNATWSQSFSFSEPWLPRLLFFATTEKLLLRFWFVANSHINLGRYGWGFAMITWRIRCGAKTHWDSSVHFLRPWLQSQDLLVTSLRSTPIVSLPLKIEVLPWRGFLRYVLNFEFSANLEVHVGFTHSFGWAIRWSEIRIVDSATE